MKTDNPIEEIWRIREEIAAENGYDVDRLFDAMEREQEQYADRLVYRVPRGVPVGIQRRPARGTAKGWLIRRGTANRAREDQ